MRRCQEVLARVGVHGASLTATVSRIAEILPMEQAHINPRILVPDTSVSTDLAIHLSLRTACDTALRHSPKAYAQALHSRISALQQCEPDPSSQNEDPSHIPTLLTPDSPLGARYSSVRTPSFPPPPQVHKPFKPKRLRRPPPSLPSVPAIRVVSFNTAKSQNTPAAILHFLNEGYDIILLQELNSPPLLPQRYAFGNDRAKVFSNVCGHRHGVSVIAGPRIAGYTSCVPPRDSDGLICGAKYPYRRQLPYTSSQFTPPRCARGPQLRTATPYSEFLLLISTTIPITSWGVILTAFWIPNLTSTAWSIYMSGTGSLGRWNTSQLGWWTLSGQSTPPSGSTPATQATAGTAKQGWITSLRPLA